MRLALGTGTGRCGTKSLRVLCMAQADCCITHERYFLPWASGEDVLPDVLGAWKRAAAGERPCDAVWEAGAEVRGSWGEGDKTMGDIGPWYLPLIPALVEDHGAQIIHLERDRDSYVESALRGPWDCFSAAPAPEDVPGDNYIASVPKYPAPREEATGMYWVAVHEMAQKWATEYPQAFRIWSMWDLDSRARQAEMMRWIGIEDPVTLERYPDRAENRLAKVGP